MAIQLETTVRNAMLDAITTKVGANGRLKFYSGAVPANCVASPGAGLLVDLACSAALAPAASGGQLTFNAITSGNATGNGTATFFRVYDSGSATCWVQGTVSTSGADINLSSTAFTVGLLVTVTSEILVAPGA